MYHRPHTRLRNARHGTATVERCILVAERRGAAVVELAVLAPFLLFFTLGTVDFGRFAKVSVSVNNAARGGAYYGSSSPAAATGTTGIRNTVVQDLQTLEGVSASDVTVTSSTSTDAENYQLVTVTVSVPFKTLFGFPTQVITVSQTCPMRVRPDQTR